MRIIYCIILKYVLKRRIRQTALILCVIRKKKKNVFCRNLFKKFTNYNN